MLMTIGTVLLVVLLFVFLVVKWNEFVDKNIKD